MTLFLTETDPSSPACAVTSGHLNVGVTSPNWKQCIPAAAERSSRAASEEVPPFFLTIHAPCSGQQESAIEVRPREGVWQPFCAAIPFVERERVMSSLMVGPSNAPTKYSNHSSFRAARSCDSALWLLRARNQRTPTEIFALGAKRSQPA